MTFLQFVGLAVTAFIGYQVQGICGLWVGVLLAVVWFSVGRIQDLELELAFAQSDLKELEEEHG